MRALQLERRLLHKRRQINQLLIAPGSASAGDRTVDAVQRRKQYEKLYLVEGEVWRCAAIIAILPSGNHRLIVLHTRQGVGCDAPMCETMAMRCCEIFHECFHIMVGHGVLVAFQRHVVAVEHQNGGFSIISHTVHVRSF